MTKSQCRQNISHSDINAPLTVRTNRILSITAQTALALHCCLHQLLAEEAMADLQGNARTRADVNTEESEVSYAALRRGPCDRDVSRTAFAIDALLVGCG